MKLFKKIALFALAAVTFCACEDVPAPYVLPGDNDEVVTGDNLLSNSDFEEWQNNKPVNWGLTVTNGTIAESSDAASGSKAVLLEGYSSSNKRFASKSYKLKAGTYNLSAYLKQSGATLGQFRLGYAKLTNGVVADTQNDYIYITSAAPVSASWKETKCNFKLDSETELAIIIMNSKYGEGASILIDNVTLTTIDGGLIDSGDDNTEEPETPDTPDTPEGVSNIADVIAAGGGSATIQGTIVATYARGFIVNDATASILVYLGEDKGYNEGDVVKVSGETSIYAGLLQFGATSTVEKVGTATVTHPTATQMDGAAMDAYLSAPSIKYITYRGVLTIDGNYYNVAIAGATTAIGSLSYPKSSVVDASLNGKEIIVTGYAIGVSRSEFVNTMAVKVEAAEGGTTEPEEPETPDTPDTPDTPAGKEVVFDFTNPTALDPSVTPSSDVSTGVEFETVTFKNSGISIKIDKGSAAYGARIWTKTDHSYELRTYNGSTMIISAPEGSDISSIVFNGGKITTMSPDSGTLSSGTWNGSANSVTFSVTGTLNIKTITVK